MAGQEGSPVKRRKTDEFVLPQFRFTRSTAAPPKIEIAHETRSSPRTSPDASQESRSKPIVFICPERRRHPLPFDACRTWQGMKDLIRDALDPNIDNSSFEEGHYHLYNSDNERVLTTVWDKIIKPGDEITMRWTPQAKSQPQPLSPPASTQAPFSPSPQSLGSQLPDPPTFSDIGEPREPNEQPVSLTLGDKTYYLPFFNCHTWEGMERCIKDACGFNKPWGRYDRHIEIQAYNLIRKNQGRDHIILPSSWEKAIKPGWIVELQMQSLPEPTLDPPSVPIPVAETSPQQSRELANIPDQMVYLSNDAVKVKIKRIRENGRVLYEFVSPDDPKKYYQTLEEEWVQRQMQGTGREYLSYIGRNTGKHFYTLSTNSSPSSRLGQKRKR